MVGVLRLYLFFHAGATGRRTSNAARALRASRARRTTSKAHGLTEGWRGGAGGLWGGRRAVLAAAAWRPCPLPPRLARAWPGDWESWYACCRALVRVAAGYDMCYDRYGVKLSSFFTTPACCSLCAVSWRKRNVVHAARRSARAATQGQARAAACTPEPRRARRRRACPFAAWRSRAARGSCGVLS